MAEPLWTILGIAPSNDRRTIKKAYATQLKKIDVEEEPQKFVALREAMEQALYLAAMAAYEIEDLAAEEFINGTVDEAPVSDNETSDLQNGRSPLDATLDTELDDIPSSNEYEETIDDPAVNNMWVEGDRLFNALSAILMEGDGNKVFLNEEEELQVHELQTGFFDWLEKSPIDVAQVFENDLAYLLTDSTPRSDPMLQNAVDSFGWDRTGNEWDRSPAISQILDRLEGNQAMAALMEPEHKWHQAYLELTNQRESGGFGNWVSKQQVRELLETVQVKYPSVEAAFDPTKVGEWERKLGLNDQQPDGSDSNIRWWQIVAAIFLVSTCVRIADLGSDAGNDPNQFDDSFGVLAEQVRQQRSLDNILENIFGDQLTVTDLKLKNPQLLSKLKLITLTSIPDIARQKPAIEGEPQQSLSSDIVEKLNSEFNIARYQANRELLTAYWSAKIDGARYFQSVNPDMCVSYLTGEPTSEELPDSIRRAELKEVARIFLNPYDGTYHTGANVQEYSVAGERMDKITRSTSLSRDVVVAAFKKEGSSAQRCAVKIALIDSVLNDPSEEALTIMRSM